MFYILLLLAPSLSNLQVHHEGWNTMETINNPTGRHENGFVECNGKFYLIGGRGIKNVEEYDPEINTWSKLAEIPVEMHHFQAIAHNGIIYIVGAMTGPYPTEIPLDCIYLYNPSNDKWTKGPRIPEARRRGSCGTVIYNGKFYMIGGIQLGHTSGTVGWFDEYDPVSNQWKPLPDAPNIRDHFPAIVVDDRLYCIGGRNTSYHEEDNFMAFFGATVRDIDVFDFKSGKWETLKEKLPVGTAAGSVAYFNKKIMYFGGEGSQKTAHNETQAMDPVIGSWEQLTPLKRGRHGTQAINYKNKIFITAGSGNQGGSPELNSTEVYSK